MPMTPGQFGPKRVLGIGFRLSIVVGILVGLYIGLSELMQVSERKASAERIWSGLQCAAKYDKATLDRVQNAFGNFEISKLGCGRGSGPDGSFFASEYEIDQARRNDRSGFDYVQSFNPVGALVWASIALVLVNVAAGLISLTWVVSRWVAKG